MNKKGKIFIMSILIIVYILVGIYIYNMYDHSEKKEKLFIPETVDRTNQYFLDRSYTEWVYIISNVYNIKLGYVPTMVTCEEDEYSGNLIINVSHYEDGTLTHIDDVTVYRLNGRIVDGTGEEIILEQYDNVFNPLDEEIIPE